MNIVITTFTNPFSFFCLVENDNNTLNISLKCEEDNSLVPRDKTEQILDRISDLNHGQYVAVMWQDRWVRGIVSMETQFLIWLIDYGKYLKPTEKTVYINLPNEFKKHSTKVFEASIHGVTPINKKLTDDCQIKNVASNFWTKGAIDKAKDLIASACKLHFIPVALLTTEHNDIVLGDLYLEDKDGNVVNIIDELSLWPVFLERSVDDYIKNLSINYATRRRHRACLTKPHILDSSFPTISPKTTQEEYNAIISAKAAQLETTSENNSFGEDGSTVIDYTGNFKKEQQGYKLTPLEIERYSNMYVTISGREYNGLNVLLNKIKDLYMCERYKDHDLKSVGRGTNRLPK